MDSKKLEILITSVDCGSFIKASEVVGYTQSGLTHMMDNLEKEIGFPLLKRSHNGIEWTNEGKALEPVIKDFLKANAQLENKITEIAKKDKNTIRVAAYASIAMHWMPEILYRFRRICPDVTVELRMVDHALEPFELLEKGETDVIFASKQDYEDIEWTTLYYEKMYAILPSDTDKKDIFKLKDYENKEFLMPYGRFDIDVNRTFASCDFKLKTTSAKVDDETLIRMVSRGLGNTMMSELMIRGKTDDVTILPIDPPVYRELGMGMHINESSHSILQLKNCVINYIKDR